MTHFSPLFSLIDPLARPFFIRFVWIANVRRRATTAAMKRIRQQQKIVYTDHLCKLQFFFFSNSRLAWRHAVKCRETARRPISSWTRYAHMWVNHYDFEFVCLSLARSRQRRRAGGLGEHAKKEFFIHEKAWRVKMSHRIWWVRSASSNLHDTNSDQPSTFLFWLIHPYHGSVSS